MTFRQLVMRKGLPFDVRIPNAETLESFVEAKEIHRSLLAIVTQKKL